MTLFALIAAVLLAYFQPWVWSEKLRVRGGHYGNFFQHHFNAGAHLHGRLAWWAATLPLLILLVILSVYLANNAPVLLVLLNITVLYGCMGFRLFSLDFIALQRALRDENLELAQTILAKHSALNTRNLSAPELANLAIQYALEIAQRKVFGVTLWFVLFSLLGLGGATGAVLYRLSNFLRSHWTDTVEYGEFATFSEHMWQRLNWLPRRGTLGEAMPLIPVADEEGRELPHGETGYLWVRGGSRALGYWQNMEKTRWGFRGEWYVSGDLIRRDADGYYTYCGRADELAQGVRQVALRHGGGGLPAAPPGGVTRGGGRRRRCQRAGEAARLRDSEGAPRGAGGGTQGLRDGAAGALQAPAGGNLRGFPADDPPGEGRSRQAQGELLAPRAPTESGLRAPPPAAGCRGGGNPRIPGARAPTPPGTSPGLFSGAVVSANVCMTSTIPTARCGPACRVVWEGSESH